MPLHVTTKPIAPSNIPTPADIGQAVEILRSVHQPWADKLASSLDSLQQFCEKLILYLKQSPPTVTKFVVSDPTTGQTVAVLGTFIPNTTGVPIVNFFSQINLYDNPDPAAAAVTCHITGGQFILQSLANVNQFVVTTPTFTQINDAGGQFGTLTKHGTNGQDATGVWQFGSAVVNVPGLPNANPGAGTKQMWYDPADGNRVKFAP